MGNVPEKRVYLLQLKKCQLKHVSMLCRSIFSLLVHLLKDIHLNRDTWNSSDFVLSFSCFVSIHYDYTLPKSNCQAIFEKFSKIMLFFVLIKN